MNTRRWIRSILAVLAILLAAGCGESSDVEYLERAKRFQDEGDFRSSLIELKNALRVNPNNLEARWLLGELHVELRDGVAAEMHLRRALELGMAREAVMVPLAKALLLQKKHDELIELARDAAALPARQQAQLLALRGEVYLDQGRLEAAQADFQAALQSMPESAAARLGQALAAARLGELEAAHEWADKALEAAPRSADVWSLKGDVENLSGNYTQAETAYGEAIKYRLDNVKDTFKRALVRIELEKYPEAQQDIETLQRIAPAHPGADYAQGLIHFRQKQFEAAQPAFERALDLNEDFLFAQFYLGATHFALDQLRQAESYLNRFLTFVPQSERAAKLLAQVRIRNGDLLGAEIVLRPLLRDNPNDPETLNLLARLRLAQGDESASIEHLERMVSLQPNAAESHLQLGLNLLREGQAERGATALRTAMQLAPQMPEAGQVLFYNYFRSGAYDKALEVAAELAISLPRNPEPHNLMGVAYMASGKLEQARAAFERALALKPDFTHARMNLAELDLRGGDLETAQARYRQILKRNPKDLDALLGLARLAERSGRHNETLSRLRQAWESHRDEPRAGLPLIQAYLARGEHLEAVKLARDLQTAHPEEPTVLQALVPALLAAGEPENALTNALRLAQLQPAAAQGWYLVATIRRRMGDYPGALAALNTALTVQEGHLPALVSRTELLLQLGRFSDALDGALGIQARYPDHVEGYRLEGDVYRYQKAFAYAVDAYRKAYNRLPSGELVLRLAEALRLAGDEEGALRTLRDWLALYPGDNRVRAQLAVYLQEAELQEAAAAEYARLAGQEQPEMEVMASIVEQNRILDLVQARQHDQAMAAAARLAEQDSDNPAPLTLKGIALLHQGDIVGARTAFQQALERAPGDPSASLNLAQLVLAQNDPVKARALYAAVLERRPDHLHTLLALAQLELGEGRPEQAKAGWEQAIRFHPAALPPRLLLAQYYLQTGQPRRAMGVIYELGTDSANQPALLAVLGQAQLQDDQVSNAIATFARIVDLEPNSAQAHYLLARAYSAGEMPLQARDELEAALRLDPQHLLANLAQIRGLVLEGRLDDGRRRLEALKQMHPNEPEILAQEGWIAMRQDRLQEAVESLTASLRQAPSSRATINLALAQWRAGDPQAGIQTLETWLKRQPEDRLASLHLANLYLLENRRDSAQRVYRQILEQAPDDIVALNNLAGLLRESDPQAALQYAERALSLSPGTPYVMDTLAMILLEQDQVERALRLLQSVTEQAPEEPSYRYHLALALARHDRQAARQLLEELLAQGKPFAEAPAAKALLESLALEN